MWKRLPFTVLTTLVHHLVMEIIFNVMAIGVCNPQRIFNSLILYVGTVVSNVVVITWET